MPVSEQEARAIAFLAASVRPHGSSKWDEAGIYANVMKVADRQLSTVVIAVMQAAEDRGAQSPGVIPTAGPHWRNPESAPRAAMKPWNPHEFCECGQPMTGHRATDHEPITRPQLVARIAAQGIDVARAVTALRDVKATETPPEQPEPVTTTEGTEHVAQLRAALNEEETGMNENAKTEPSDDGCGAERVEQHNPGTNPECIYRPAEAVAQ